MVAMKVDIVMAALLILAGALCVSAAKEKTVLKQATDVFIPVKQIMNAVEQKGGVTVSHLKSEMYDLSRKARNLLSILPRRVLELMADLEQILNTTDHFVATSDSDFSALTLSFDHVLGALSGAQNHLEGLVPVEMTAVAPLPAKTPNSGRWKRFAMGSCCYCCGTYSCGRPCHCPCLGGMPGGELLHLPSQF
ncbi:hypothetical protein ACOMHN_061695 [Nucella lapillus]